MGVGDDMNKEIKKQLILSFVLLTFVVATLFFWYQNFIFHTYGEKVDYQYCLYAQNEEWQIAGYEFYQKELSEAGNSLRKNSYGYGGSGPGASAATQPFQAGYSGEGSEYFSESPSPGSR